MKERKLDRTFRFLPYQDREQLKYSLSVPDIHWVSMKPNLEGLLFPSKFYGIAAAGRPVIAIAAQDSEIAKLSEDSNADMLSSPAMQLASPAQFRISRTISQLSIRWAFKLAQC